ncbi:hypothetical protein QR680_009023 [Steinernema hermaphroditum]|uniref:BLOC-1-related complex subunit 5 n=1 Tax=Steinernema hermaphroditum TaxID=289476 RepID=A0AA39IIR2_9BILA|nr:hypothetical protein QR680_009023 [Steinernema hermaphroditum]
MSFPRGLAEVEVSPVRSSAIHNIIEMTSSASLNGGVVSSIRDTLLSVQNELTHSVQKLRLGGSAAPSLQACSDEAIAAIVTSDAGSNLVLKYQLHLQQIHDMGAEAARLSNICSTRMGNLHQTSLEHGRTMVEFSEDVHRLPVLGSQIRELNRDLHKINRFLLQTEIALKNLECIHEKVALQQENPGAQL